MPADYTVNEYNTASIRVAVGSRLLLVAVSTISCTHSNQIGSHN